MKENIAVSKSFDFALKIIKSSYYLKENGHYVLSNQLLRSGTSIGANIKESINSISKAEFRNKLSIALKEADETEYWIELIEYSNILSKNECVLLLNDCRELCRILSSSLKTLSK
ncbi:four helix bundle protein [Clostridium sp. BJN0001]|uniref:four helix bundle protein n=1 Tax=Clostridium sp. BJN0001 TaxID=2930219 RepID=UPI001FD44152|nr:four helix bundle protein [Clostridium sp. BJN0001]